MPLGTAGAWLRRRSPWTIRVAGTGARPIYVCHLVTFFGATGAPCKQTVNFVNLRLRLNNSPLGAGGGSTMAGGGGAGGGTLVRQISEGG